MRIRAVLATCDAGLIEIFPVKAQNNDGHHQRFFQVLINESLNVRGWHV